MTKLVVVFRNFANAPKNQIITYSEIIFAGYAKFFFPFLSEHDK